MRYIVTKQLVDGKTVLTLPDNVSKEDFEDWLNDRPWKKNIEFRELPERWTSLDAKESNE